MDTFIIIILILVIILFILIGIWRHQSIDTPCSNKLPIGTNYEQKPKLPPGWDMENYNTKTTINPTQTGGVAM
jgi:hypothetical protein